MTGCREAFAACIDTTDTHRFGRAWAAVADEVDEVRDRRWRLETDGHAVVTDRYPWQGVVAGSARTGGGLGTNVRAARAGPWQGVHEHLTPQPAAGRPGAGCRPAPSGPGEA